MALSSIESPLKRLVKRLLKPFVSSSFYQNLHALSMAYDIRMNRLTEPEIDLIASVIHPGETAYDVGANFGMYTYPLSKQVGKNGKIIAFEPVPYTFKTLRKVISILGLKNVHTYQLAVASRLDPVTLSIPLQSNGHIMGGQAYLSNRNDDHGDTLSQVRWQSITSVECESISLDIFQRDIDTSAPAFIKMDIEGAEYFALQGSQQILSRYKPTLLLEINPWFLEGFRVSLTDLFHNLLSFGYLPYVYEASSRQLFPLDSRATIIERNYFFIHPSRLSRFNSFLTSTYAS